MGLLQMSISAGILVVVVVLIRSITLNKLPKTTFLILWGVVLFRLFIPAHIPIQLNFYPSVGIFGNVDSFFDVTPEIYNNVTNDLPFGEFSTSEFPMWARTPNPINIETLNYVSETVQKPGSAIPPALIIWIAGMTALFIFFGVIYIKSHRRLRFATLIRDNSFVNAWLQKHKLLRSISVMQSDRVATPLAVGLYKPRIILPKNMNMYNKQLLNHVLTHEYYHIKRFDALWKILLTIAVCVHWFNPLVWIMFLFANRDLEVTCDELVVRRLGVEAKSDYAHSIIGMAQQINPVSFHPAFSRNTAEKILNERIESVMKIKKKSLASIAAALLLVVALTVGTLTVFATNVQEDDTDSGYVPAFINSDVQELKAANASYLYDILTARLTTEHPDEDFRIEKTPDGWAAYNTKDIIAPCGTAITSEEFVKAMIAYEASGRKYWPHALQLLFPHDSGTVAPHVQLMPTDYENSYTIYVDWLFSNGEPVVRIVNPDDIELCMFEDDIPPDILQLAAEAVELSMASPFFEAHMYDPFCGASTEAASSCTHPSARMQEQTSITNTTASFCWVTTQHYTLWCDPCADVVGTGSKVINGPLHTFQMNPQRNMVCTNCLWIQ
jgi:beta-lactamase regulating signal transducer with metallopeptidase domain